MNNWLGCSLVMSCTIGSQGAGKIIPESTFLDTCAPFPVIILCYLFLAMHWRGQALRRWAWSQDTFPGSSPVGIFARIALRLFSAIHDSLILWGRSALWLRPWICVSWIWLKHEALLDSCEFIFYLCCYCGILELYSNLIPRFIQVSLVGTRLVHLRHIKFAPMMHLSFTITAAPPLHSVMLCLIALMTCICRHSQIQEILFLGSTCAWIGEWALSYSPSCTAVTSWVVSSHWWIVWG